MKMPVIQKVLIKQTVIIAIILGVAGGGLFAISMVDDHYTKEVNDLKRQTDEIVRSYASLDSEYSQFRNNLDGYRQIQEKMNMNKLTVNQSLIREGFANARKKYNFDNFKANIGAINPREGKYKLSKVQVNATDLTLTMDAMTDQDIFGLMNELQETFSSINYTSLKMSVNGEIDKPLLQRVTQDGFVPLVNCEMKFVWSGLQNITENPADALIEEKAPQPSQSASPPGNRIRIKQVP